MEEIKIKYEFPDHVEHNYIFNFQWELRNLLQSYQDMKGMEFEVEGLHLE